MKLQKELETAFESIRAVQKKVTRFRWKDSGEVYVRGLYGVPEYYKNDKDTKSNEWFWAEDKEKTENFFLNENSIYPGRATILE